MDVAFEHLKVLRVPHKIGINLQHNAGNQCGAACEDVGHVQSKHQVVADVDKGWFNSERVRVVLVADAEIVHAVRKRVDRAWEKCEKCWMF